MQCPSCHFENLPGGEACARCASPLRPSPGAIEPPRASRFRVVTQARRVRYQLRNLAPDLSAWRARLDALLPEQLHWRALAWSIIPGLGHLRTARPRLGWTLLLTWLVCLAASIVTVATGWNWLFFTAMVATHTVAILAVFAANLAFERYIWRALFGMAVFFCVQLLLYTPVTWFGTRFLLPVSFHDLAEGSRVISPRDGLLVTGAWLRPDSFERGDIVIYQVRSVSGNGYIIQPGLGIDRVVGLPHDRVQIHQGEVLVNGAPLPAAQPLGSIPLAGGFDVRLGPHQYAVFPTLLRLRRGLPDDLEREVFLKLMLHSSVVDMQEISAKVLWCVRPLTRFGPVR